MDAGHGHNLDFEEVNLQNEANTWLTSKDALAATDANNNNGVAAAGGTCQQRLSLCNSVLFKSEKRQKARCPFETTAGESEAGVGSLQRQSSS